jgi:hypothetical protein
MRLHIIDIIMSTCRKSVSFNTDSNKVYYTYSSVEYDRYQIDTTVGYKKITCSQLMEIYAEVNRYKTQEMKVHPSSKMNTRLHKVNLVLAKLLDEY